jgi:hypothetical protein
MGNAAQALAIAEKEPLEELRFPVLAMVHHRLGNAREAEALLDEAVRRFAAGAAYQIAEAYASRDDVDRAFEWLDRSYDQRDPGTIYAMCDPWFQPLYEDPRWVAFMRRMGHAE